MTVEAPRPAGQIVLALAGDAMLGRGVASELHGTARPAVISSELAAAVRSADLFVLNLECCISRRGAPWPDPEKQFFFRAPPEAADVLARMGVDCVTVANNHAMDFGREALLDTLEHLRAAGIATTGAGADLAGARAPAFIGAREFRLAVVGVTDYPADYAAGTDQPGVAFADLRSGEVPSWLLETLSSARAAADALLLTPHWGPNLTPRPPQHVRSAAAVLRRHATFVAGHSAHVFHGVEGNVLYDLGDFVNDYVSVRPSRNLLAGVLDKLGREITGVCSEVAAALRNGAEPRASLRVRSLWQLQQWRAQRIARMVRARTMRPDLGLLFLVTLDRQGPVRLEAIPLKIGRCHTGLATGRDALFAQRRFRAACRALGTEVDHEDGRLVVVWRS